jgi:hypothetical protein
LSILRRFGRCGRASRRSWSSASFGNLLRRWCNDAGLPQCSAHGLRKAACRRLAEVGCSAPEIAAISGHKSLKEVQRYIEEADQVRLAQAAIRRIIGQTGNGIVANPDDAGGYPKDSSKNLTYGWRPRQEGKNSALTKGWRG